MRRLALALALVIPVLAHGEDAVAPTTEELRKLIEEQRKLIEQQGAQIEKQGQEIEALRQKLDEVGAKAAAPATPALPTTAAVAPPVGASPSPSPSPDATPAPSHAKADNDVSRVPEETGRTVTFEDFDGAIALPGTSARVRLGGWVRSAFVSRRDPMGSQDRFVPSSIAVGEPLPGQTTGTVFTARPTRLSLDLRTPTGVGAMRAFVETDFRGTGANVRLRHAFGKWGWLLFGQTWSAFSDVKAEPDSINDGALWAATHLRQPGARVTAPLGRRTALTFSVEAPDPAVSGGQELSGLPDTFLAFRFAEDRSEGAYSLFAGGGHFQTAVVVRQLGATNVDGATVHAAGYGATITGRVSVPLLRGREWVIFGVVAGHGVGHYIHDLDALGGQDGVLDPATGVLEPLPAASGYLAIEHWWSKTMRSTFGGGIVSVDNLDIQLPDALHRTEQAQFNFAWSPIRRVDLVAELLWGQRTNKDGNTGEATQLQFGATFRF